jgi:hypothetical protein
VMAPRSPRRITKPLWIERGGCYWRRPGLKTST